MKREKMRRNASSDQLRDFRNCDEDGQNFGIKALSDNDYIPKQNPLVKTLHKQQPRRPRTKKRKEMKRAASSARLRDLQDADEEDSDVSLSDSDTILKTNPVISLHKRQPRQPYKEFESTRKYGLGRLELSRPARLKRQQIQATAPAVTFGYELYDGCPDQSTTVLPISYIDPESLELQCRIGHGVFGDVWIGIHHQSGKDYNEYQKVAVKKLHPINTDHVQEFLHKFEEVWRNLKSKQLNGVCWLHGISIISGQICIVFKWYEWSVGGQIVTEDGRKLPLRRVLSYSSELAKGIQQLHQLGHLVLNLKPSNFLLDVHDHVFLGDFGIPYLLLETFWSDPCLAMRLGTPNYMAPEQWEPGVRGPVSYETDSWGFACSMIEMLTGVPPWFGKSTEEMRHAVVIRQEKPQVPTGLPPEVGRILEGCFEYDFRKRPLIPDILLVLERERKTVLSKGSRGVITERNLYVNNGLTTWFQLKDHILIGDTVRSKKDPNKPQRLLVSQGLVVGRPDMRCERDKLVVVKCPNIRTQFRLNVSSLQRVTSGFASGDWVQLLEANRKHSSLGIVHHIQRDGTAAVGFLGLKTLWRGRLSELKLVEEPFVVGQFVRLKANISDPQFEWPYKRGTSRCIGKISKIYPNGCLEVRFPGRFFLGDEGCSSFLANPEEVEHVSFMSCRGIVEKYEFVEDLHWAVKPIAIVFGLVAVANIGAFAGRKLLSGISEEVRNETTTFEVCNEEKQSKEWLVSGISEGTRKQTKGWLPPKVANIIFKVGAPNSFMIFNLI